MRLPEGQAVAHTLQSAETGSQVPPPTANLLPAKRRFTNEAVTLPHLPGVSDDAEGSRVSLWSGSRPILTGLAGDSLSSIWPVHEGSLVGRKAAASRLAQRARTPDSRQLRRRRILSGSRRPATESSRQRRAQRSVSPEHSSLLRPVRGIGSRRASTVMRADCVPARIASVMSGARKA